MNGHTEETIQMNRNEWILEEIAHKQEVKFSEVAFRDSSTFHYITKRDSTLGWLYSMKESDLQHFTTIEKS